MFTKVNTTNKKEVHNMKRKVLAALLALTMICTPVTTVFAQTESNPVDITDDLSEEENKLISSFLMGLSGAAIVEGQTYEGDKVEYSSDESYDYDKIITYFFMLDQNNYKDLNTFEEAGLLEETQVTIGKDSAVNGYNVSTEQYADAIDYIWEDGLSDEKAAEEFLESLSGVTLNEDKTYKLYSCLEVVHGEIVELSVSQTSETTYVIDAKVKAEFGLDDGIYDVYVEAKADEDNPFAGMTVTETIVTCVEWNLFNDGSIPVMDSRLEVDGTWIQAQDGTGRWWFKHPDGTYMKNGWELINGKWYRFDQYGWMQTGWVKDSEVLSDGIKSYWFYLGADGAMVTGWLWDGSNWYYLQEDGKMATGWLWNGNHWYYLNPNGDMATGWAWDGNAWYYLNANGDMATGWVLDGDTWYYLNANGTMATGWIYVGNHWYYLNADGSMACNETLKINGVNYSFNKNGEWYK